MQINLLNPAIKEFFKILGWPLLFMVLWLNGCSKESTATTKITLPAVVGKLESKKPYQQPVKWPEKGQEKPVVKWHNKEISIENPVNIELAQQYVVAKDSIERLNLYLKAIQLNSFSSKFEDKYLKLTLNGIVRGEVQEITPTYEIKERAAEAIIKETYLRVFIGASLGINKDLDRGLYKFDVDFMNKNGDIFSAEYMRVNSQDFGIVGIKKSILNLKR